MPDIITDKWVKQLAMLAALLALGLSLSHGVALVTCGARFALVYCVTMFMGRLACQMWQWATSSPSPPAAHFANHADTFSTAPSSDEGMMDVGPPIEQGG
jgi:hypothetical protein